MQHEKNAVQQSYNLLTAISPSGVRPLCSWLLFECLSRIASEWKLFQLGNGIYAYRCPIVHAGAEIIGHIVDDDLPPGPRLEVIQFSFCDIFFMYDDKEIPVGSTLFVPEADCMPNLVGDCAILSNIKTTRCQQHWILKLAKNKYVKMWNTWF